MALTNYTQQALRDLATTTSRTISASSRGKLSGLQLQHDITKENVGLSRQEFLDRMAAPGLQLESDKAQAELDRRAKPVTLTSLSDGNLWRMGHLVSSGKGKGDENPFIEEIAQGYGATFDRDKKSATYGQMVRQDGSVVTQGEIEDNPEPLTFATVKNWDTERGIRDMIEMGEAHLAARNQELRQNPELKYSPDLQQEMSTIRQRISGLKEYQKNPKAKIDDIDSQILWLQSKVGTNPAAQVGIARLEKKQERLWQEYMTDLKTKAAAILKFAVEKGKSATPSTMEKEVRFMASVLGMSNQKALELWRSDDLMGEKLRAFAEIVNKMPLDVELDSKRSKDYIEEQMLLFGLQKPAGAPEPPTGGDPSLTRTDESDPFQLGDEIDALMGLKQ